MVNNRAFVKGLAKTLPIVAITIAASCLIPALPPADAEESVTLVKHSNKATDYYKAGDWGRAKDEFRTCIGLAPDSVEYYEGLYNTCIHSNEWDQVAFAIEKIFQLDPKQRQQLAYVYGQALYHLNKFDDAIPYLKAALRTADIPEPEWIPRIKDVPTTAPDPTKPPLIVQPPQPVTPPPPPPQVDPSKFALSYLNAVKSECICLADYEGYEKSPEIGWNHPPRANFRITEILKGPPLNKDCPVKFEFHDNVDPTMPKGWKFGEDKMPTKGSKWILFIEFAVPKRGMFELYQGSYGRQPFTDDNVNQLYALLDKFNMRNTHS